MKSFAKDLPGELKFYTDYKKMCKDPDIDAVFVGTPNQWHVPIALEAVQDLLHQQVEELAGVRYSRKRSDNRRWGSQGGSVYLGDQKVSVRVPRVRNVRAGREVSLPSYRALQQPRNLDDDLLLRVLKGISCRNYEACAQAVPEAFGLSSSTVSRRFIRSTAHKLRVFQERPLDDLDLCPDGSGSFTTVAGGTGPFSYLWRKDGAVLVGETNASLSLTGVSAADAGEIGGASCGDCG